jgi:hypothetical protein
MKVYLNLAFIKALENIILQSPLKLNDDNDVQIQNVLNVRHLLQVLPIVIDAECNYHNRILPILKCFKEEELSLLKIILKRNPTASFENLFCEDVNNKFKDNSGIYFVNDNGLKEVAEKTGITFCDGDYLKNNYLFKDYNLNIRPFDGCFNNVLNVVPPTNSMLIIDRYIFDKPFDEKLNNLLVFITKFKQNCTQIPFHLSIIYSDQKGTLPPQNVQIAFNKLSTLENIEVELILLKRNIPRDRVIYTNYSIIDIGHPFETTDIQNRKTVYNQMFIPQNNDFVKIKNKIDGFKNILNDWKKTINGILKSDKMQTNPFKNRIFSEV